MSNPSLPHHLRCHRGDRGRYEGHAQAQDRGGRSGRAEIRNVYKIAGVGAVAGCYVLDGKMVRSANIRVVRDGIIIADDKMASLRRFKDDVKEVAQGYECGITLEKFSDLKNGDIF